jgi:1,4-alpha-glucan branching enzyme
MLNRRRDEKHVAYVESHDQALVGSKALAFWLMDAEMYWNMDIQTESLVVARGIALHKMIRLITFALGGEGYLNFMGNEFGHPEWIDFPREGNHNSYQYARRQWSLADNEFLHYQGLNRFDMAMQQLDHHFWLLRDPMIEQIAVDEDTRQMVFRRGPLVFALNLSIRESFPDHRIPIPEAQDYTLVLDTDSEAFSGLGRCKPASKHIWHSVPMADHQQSMLVYLPSRSMQVYAPERLSGEIAAFRGSVTKICGSK